MESNTWINITSNLFEKIQKIFVNQMQSLETHRLEIEEVRIEQFRVHELKLQEFQLEQQTLYIHFITQMFKMNLQQNHGIKEMREIFQTNIQQIEIQISELNNKLKKIKESIRIVKKEKKKKKT